MRKVIGGILAVGGIALVALAGEIMNSAEIDTARIAGGAAAAVGIGLIAMGKRKQP